MTNKIRKGTVIGFRIWDKERKEFVRFHKLSKLAVTYETDIVRLKDASKYEFKVIKKK